MTPTPEQKRELNERIVLLRCQLREALMERAGTRDHEGTAWCVCCGERQVFPSRGEDTCPSCVRQII